MGDMVEKKARSNMMAKIMVGSDCDGTPRHTFEKKNKIMKSKYAY